MRIQTSDDPEDSAVRVEENLGSAGLISRGALVIFRDGLTTAEYLTFNNPTDTIYAHYARKLGPPIHEGLEIEDSTYRVLFRDKTFDYELFDSDVVISAHNPSISNERKWVLLGEDDFSQSFIDTSFDYERYFMVKRAVRPGDPLGAGALFDLKYPGLGYDKFAYSLVTYEVNCKRKAIITRNRVDYTVDDKFIRYDNAPDKKWWTPDSDSYLSRIIDDMCN